MKPSRVKYSAWISLLVLLLVSCKSPQVLVYGEGPAEARESLCSGAFDKMDFKAKVVFRENELDGRMLIKKTGDGVSKVAFYNELGMTYLEGTLLETKPGKTVFTANYYADFLDYDVFLNSFGKCLVTVFQPNGPSVAKSANPVAPGDDFIHIFLPNSFQMKLTPK